MAIKKELIINNNKNNTIFNFLYKDIFTFPWYVQVIIIFNILFIITWFWLNAASSGIKNAGLDFATPFFATKAWLHGANPYDDFYIAKLWQKETGKALTTLIDTGRLSLYPITTFPILFPFTFFNFNQAKILWFSINFLCLIYQIYIFIKLANLKYTQLGAIIIASLALLFIPNKIGFIQANIGFFTVSCVIFSLWAYFNNNDIFSGIFIAISCAIKPHVGIPFLLLFIINKKWKVLAVFIISLSVALFVSLYIIGLDHCITYLTSFENNIIFSMSKGEINDPSLNNPFNFHLINLQHPLWAIFNDKLITNFTTFLIVGVELIIFISLVKRYKIKKIDLIQISTLSSIILLPIYHRIYDASILFVNVPLAMILSCTKYKIYGLILLTILLPFILINSANFIHFIAIYGYVSNQLSQSLIWKAFLQPHQSWLIFSLSVISLCLMKNLYKDNYSL